MDERFNQSPYEHAYDDGGLMDFDYGAPLPLFLDQSGGQPPHDARSWNHQHGTVFTNQLPETWPMRPYQGQNFEFDNSHSSIRSSQSSNARSSSNTMYSHHHSRQSSTSTNTSWSQVSTTSREQYISQTERLLSANSIHPLSPGAVQTYDVAQDNPQRRPSQPKSQPTPQPASTKEQFSTCVSRIKRSRRSTKEPRYWCTSCEEGFGEKYDWKRHEETYQERTETFLCDNCNKIYHLEKDFINHHQKSHRCRTCAENHHLDTARRRRKGRSVWGCGFCDHFDTDWTERCNHIAWHFERNGENMSKWKQTRVILSLLKQPYIHQEWMRLLEHKQESRPSFEFKKQKTGRAEGYPDSDRPPQLQDLLEFFEPGQNAAAIAELAYDLGHRSPQSTPKSLNRLHWTKGSTGSPTTIRGASATPSPPRPNKELPLAPGAPPPVPPKDVPGINMAHSSLPYNDEYASWHTLIDTIPEDHAMPDSMSMDLSNLQFGVLSDELDPSFPRY